jgi:hypothetical protein
MIDTVSFYEVHGKTYEQKHGNPFDRGSADSYYGRRRCPHKGGVGGNSGPRIEQLDDNELEAYHAGYDWNEQFGDKKNYD